MASKKYSEVIEFAREAGIAVPEHEYVGDFDPPKGRLYQKHDSE